MQTRREWLEGTAVAVAAAASTATGIAAEKQGDLVDAHVHVWTPDVGTYPLADAFTVADMQPPSFTADELLETCTPHGVGRVVLIQMSFYNFDNRYMLDAIAAHPGRFAGVAIVDHGRPDVALGMRAIARRGVTGFRLYADRERAEAWENDAGIKAMWACGADENLAMCLLADPDALPAIRRMCASFPRTPVVIDHVARIGMRGPVDPAQLDALLDLATFPTVAVKTSAFYALGKKTPPYDDLGDMIRRLRDAYGAERLMWASDCPYQLADGQGYGPSIALVRDRLDFLSAAERRAILRDTATRIFFRT